MNGTANLEDLRIRDLFELSPANPGKLAMSLKPENFRKIEQEARSFAQPMAWSDVRTGLAGVITDALDTKVLDGWVSAWQKWKDVKEAAEKSVKSAKPVPCPLLEHSIESSLQPYVEVFFGPKSVERINFEVKLTTEIYGSILKLKNGSLISIQMGSCEWSISIALENGPELFDQPLTQLDLPASVVLQHPIPLYADERVAAEQS